MGGTNATAQREVRRARRRSPAGAPAARAPATRTAAGSGSRTSRCAADSTTTSVSAVEPRTSLGSARSVRQRADRAASPGRSGGPRRCRCRRSRPSRRAAPPPRAGAAAGPRRRPVAVAEVEQALRRRRWRPAPRRHLAQRGRLGVGHPEQRRRRRRSPDGWAKPRLGGAARRAAPRWWCRPTTAVVPAAGSNVQSWWMPAIATTRRAVPPGHVPRRRQLCRGRAVRDRRSRSWRRCPPPWSTAPSASRTPRRAWLTRVGDHDVVAVRTSGGSRPAPAAR